MIDLTILVKYFPILGAICVALVGFGQIKAEISEISHKSDFQYKVVSEQLTRIDNRLNALSKGH